VTPPQTLPAALLSHATAHPEEPWLFRGEGWDWRWHSWAELASWMAFWAERLSTLPPGTRVPFPATALPASIIADLAIQAAGLIAVPDPAAAYPTDAEASPLPHHPPPERWPSAGGAVVHRDGLPVELTQSDLIEGAQRIQKAIQPLSRGEDRQVVVLSGPWNDPAERALLSWATVTGAALLLEPSPELRVATAVWARPTLFHGTAEEISRLRRATEGLSQRFQRLRTVLVTGPEMAAEDSRYWEGRGVKGTRMPEL